MPSITIADRKFPSKSAAEAHIRQILGRYANGEALRGEDDVFVRALVELHPRRAVIVDCGLAWIFVQHLDACQRRFVVRRTDSSIRDFAWRAVLSPKDAKRRLASVLRWLIRSQLLEYRDRAFRHACEACAAAIAACHVDHIAPATFEALMAGWLGSVRREAEDIGVIPSPAYQEPDRLEDESLAQSWMEYHEINARLRCVCQRCNLSTLRKNGA
jgi:hypothetical protein